MFRALSLSVIVAALLVGVLAAAGLLSAEPPPERSAEPPPYRPDQVRSLETLKRPAFGDFDEMLERGIIRVLVPHSRTLFYYDYATERGVTVDAVREFERYLNRRYGKFRRTPITVAILATPRDKLLDELNAGLGDIAAGDITITEERRAQVDFSVPVAEPFSEIVVTSPSAPRLRTLDDLAGREVHARPATSTYASLVALSRRFAREGKPALKVTTLPDQLSEEDVLEMLNTDLIQISAADSWIANLWSDTLPRMRLYPDLRLRENARVAWAFRKYSPQLRRELDDFITNVVNRTQMSRASIRRFAANAARLHNARGGPDWHRFQEIIGSFRKYGAKYRFDPLLLAAQGYQESRLRQGARSGVGAIGVMQLMPRTAAYMMVGDPLVVDSNIHAGAKYMDELMSRFFDDPTLDEQNRTLFAIASYNAGPSRMPRMRAEAARMGLDPNRWFNNVEIVVSRRISLEPVLYVRNIYKYYAAYVLATQAAKERERAREEEGLRLPL